MREGQHVAPHLGGGEDKPFLCTHVAKASCMSTRRAPRADAMRPSLKKLSLGRLSLQPMATGAFIDDPELQDATDVFARIWSKAAD